MTTSTTTDFDITLRPGTFKLYVDRYASLYVHVVYKDGKLSMTGVHGPLSSGNALGGCGQVHDVLKPSNIGKLSQGWDDLDVLKLASIWKRWHLNDLRAGTPRQEDAVRNWIAKGNKYDYTQACDMLESCGLLVDNGHKYGHGWLTEQVPDNVLLTLQSFPKADKEPAWR